MFDDDDDHHGNDDVDDDFLDDNGDGDETYLNSCNFVMGNYEIYEVLSLHYSFLLFAFSFLSKTCHGYRSIVKDTASKGLCVGKHRDETLRSPR